jgi:asparagine N-glycosylation enzyme membrane subunit Stt3
MFNRIDYPFLIATFVSFVFSVALWFLVSHDYGLFVGIWVPSILALWVGVRVVLLAASIDRLRNR